LNPPNNTGTTQATYNYGNDQISMNGASADSFYLHDGLGTTRQLTDSVESVTVSYTYESFGNLIASTGTSENTYGFTGEQQFKEADGLVFLRARYYDTSVGRFISRDPIGYKGGINIYSYVYNSPLMYVDPFGLAGSYVGGEAHFFIGYGRTAVNCEDECGKERTMVFRKWCFGGAIGAGIGGGLVRGVDGSKCKPSSYEGWFYEAAAAVGIGIAGAGVGVDIGYEDDGSFSGTVEGGVHSGYGAKVKSTWCRYKYLSDR
jgi:RHS repeat-associated protein